MRKNFTCLQLNRNVIVSYNNFKSMLHTKPLEHKIPSIIPATNEAQFKLPKDKNIYIYIKFSLRNHFNTFIFRNRYKFINKTFTFNNIILINI